MTFVWLFASILSTSFRIFDCSKGVNGLLIMDPSIKCGPNAEYAVPASLSGIIFALYFVVPNVVLAYTMSRDMHGWLNLNWRLKHSEAVEDIQFRIKYARAVEDYKHDRVISRAWDAFHNCIRCAIVAGTVVMYEENRFITHASVMVLSLVMHAYVLPYKDTRANIVAILFCLCDLVGILSNRFAPLVLQIVYCILVIGGLLFLVFMAADNTRRHMHSTRRDSRVRQKDQYSPLPRGSCLRPFLQRRGYGTEFWSGLFGGASGRGARLQQQQQCRCRRRRRHRSALKRLLPPRAYACAPV